MKSALARKVNSNPAYLKIFEWGKLIAITGSSQAIIQLMGLLSGIFVIRMLSTHQYGLYVLANTMLGTMSVLSDGGISTAVMAQGGKVWTDRKQLGKVLSTGFELRKLFSYGSLIVSIPILFYLLYRHDAGILTSVLITLSIIPVFLSSLSGSLLQIGLTLNQDIRPLQRNQIIVNASRFLLLIAALFITPWAFVAILASAVPQIWGNYKLRTMTSKYADWGMLPDAAMRKEILRFVKRTLPGAIYFCLSGQITIWLISLFGSTNSVAQIGALGRLSMMLSFFSVMFATIVVPRFSRLPSKKSVLLRRYFAIQSGLLVLSALIICIIYIYPKEVLWVLGKSYANLETELLLSVISSCLGLIAGSIYSLSTSRGWAINPLVSIPLSVGTIILGVFALDITSIYGVLKFNILLMSVEVIMYLVYIINKIINENN
ncbi:polysaccharide biosynthesis protein [Pedobacter sp. P351]|uniref:polysaccharide biosynthesis protein n=1 Tax=Pedobacter superstes TaxID=3133441 RepID=UPI0030AA923B